MAPANDPRGEAGFTLVEMLVAMLLAVIVMLALLATLDSFSRNAARQSKKTDANGQVRQAMDRIVADLRQARTIEVAGGYDLVYTVSDSATAYRRERICMDSSNYIWRSSVTTSTPPSPAIASGTPCPTTGVGAYKLSTLKSANSGTNTIFSYASGATASTVRSVGVTIALNSGAADHADVTTLRASTFVRAKSQTAPTFSKPPIKVACSNSGVPTLTLDGSAGPLSVTYTDVDGHELGSGASVVLNGYGTSTIVANLTSSTGIVSQIVKTLAC
jgi:prepilin-type N-terminal cleavage/methylation domain-containing protein